MSIEDRLSTWLGAPVAKFKAVYSFNTGGYHRDVDVHDHGNGNQYHNPFLGATEAPAFLLDSEIHFSENVKYFVYKNNGFIATSDNSRTPCESCEPGPCTRCDRNNSSPSRHLKRLASMNGLEILQCSDRESRQDFRLGSMTFHRDVATFVKLPPNKFNAKKPFTCCDVHKTFSKLASIALTDKFTEQQIHDLVTVAADEGTDVNRGSLKWFMDLLQCGKEVSRHLAFKDVRQGSFYKALVKGIDRHDAAERRTKFRGKLAFF